LGNYKQAGRLLEFSSPLGQDVLLLQDLNGEEGISRLFSFRLHLLSENKSIKYEDIIAQKVTITIRVAGTKRYIHGHVNRFVQGRMDERFTHYEAEVVPAFWFLTQTSDCRIFQNKSIPDILKAVLDEKQVATKLQLTGSYAPRDYCVQYRESDFAFASRLMEQYGIFYFFEHESDKHTLVLADAPTAHKPCPEIAKARYEISGEAAKAFEDTVVDWETTQHMKTGKYSMTDYFFEAPTTNLLVSVPSTVKGAKSTLDTYDYPGEYTKKDQGDGIAKVRMQEIEASHLLIRGEGYCRSFVSGYSFDLTSHYRNDANQSYVLCEVDHQASVGDTYYTDKEGGAEETYKNRFTCIPKKIPYRPQRVTHQPCISGPQPALVVGPSGNEIWVDKYGRVKVQFYWDRQGKKDENSSCWVRVSQPWAGSNYGAIWIPRIGQEVLVEFFEGDPDQPIITGRVYNAQQMPPYTLPEHHTRSTFKSRSSKGGGSSNFNELRFEDKKGSEQVFLHAEKEMDLRVKEESREFVGHSRHLIVKKDQKELVEGNKHLEVKQDHNEKIGKNMSHEVKLERKEKVGTNLSVDVKMNRDEKTGMGWAHEAGTTVHIKAGLSVVIEAGAQISLKVGGSFVDINPAMVSIKGPMVHINSAGAAGSGPGAKPSAPDAPAGPDEADDGSKGTKK
jgi:type VI secretion system secreted protein VgrG